MITYNLKTISEITKGKVIGDSNATIEQIFFDSRLIVNPINGVFFAFKNINKDGFSYVEDAYKKGIRNFVVDKPITQFGNINQLIVQNPLNALQEWAIFHRNKFCIPVIGITGSNGKTIIKEWLNQILWQHYNICRSPKSYNSQIGTALSVLQLNEENNLAIFEAGISLPNEMEVLKKMVKPSIGVLGHIGEAHLENFRNQEDLIKEKLKLFKNSNIIIYNADNKIVNQLIKNSDDFKSSSKITYGFDDFSTVKILNIIRENKNTSISILHNHKNLTYSIPFTDDASIENSLICICSIISLGIDIEQFKKNIEKLSPIEMRLEIKEAINQSILINDSFNSDLNSLKIGLNVLNQQPKDRKSLVLTDILQSNLPEEILYSKTANLVNAYNFTEIVLIGKTISKYKDLFKSYVRSYLTTDDFLKHFKIQNVFNEAILLKGARPFKLEKLSHELETRTHDTVLEINLQNLIHNVSIYRSFLKSSTKVMCMVKANSYGMGSFEIASTLQNNGVDYLGVAIADEGKELRKAGISLPIIVMNPEQSSYSTVIDYQLEPEIYSFRVLDLFVNKLKEKQISNPYPIHIKLETGMNRLGFHEEEYDDLITYLKNTPQVYIQSIFTHLATADMPTEQEYAKYQLNRFDNGYQYLTEKLNITPLKHALNSPGIVAYTNNQYDMVRLGIGMYGYSEYTDFMHNKLKPVVQFKTVISQISNLKIGETVSYGRKFTAKNPSKIATLPVGYADGIRRSLGYGKGKVSVNGKLAPITGTICMDMMMVDVTEIDCKEGDDVIIFGSFPTLESFTKDLDTIPYEVLTSISQRVKRIYYKE